MKVVLALHWLASPLINVNLNETRQGRALQKEVDGSEIVWGPSPSRERKGVLNEGLAALWSLLLL